MQGDISLAKTSSSFHINTSHCGYLSSDGFNEDLWFAEAAFARRQPMMCRQPQIREETVEVIQLIPQSQIPVYAEEQIVDVPVLRNLEEIGERIFDYQRLLLQQGNLSPRVAIEIVFQPLHPDSGAPLDEERVVCRFRRNRILHLEFYPRDVTDGVQLSWKTPVDVVSKNFQEVIKVDRQLESTVQPLVGLGFHSLGIESVDHDALRLDLLKEGWAADSICVGLFSAG